MNGDDLLGRVYNNLCVHISTACQQGHERSLSDQLIWPGGGNQITEEMEVLQ